MTHEEQDKLWAELSEENKTHYREQYSEQKTMSESGVPQLLEELFGEHNLQPALTYEDVAWELFRKNTWIYDYEMHEIKKIEVNNQYYHFNCTSERQVSKLIAINRLLNVAKFLNKNEDGSDWMPDWNYVQDKWYLAVEKGMVKVDYHDDGHNSHIVYFRTQEIAQQAIQILGEDVVRTALTTEY